MFAATLSNKLKHTHPRWCSLWSILSGSEKQVTKFNINGLKHGPTHTGAVRFVCFCPSNRAALLVNGNKRERAAAIRWTKRENFAKFDSVQSRGSWVTAATERQLNVFSAADWQRVIKIKSNAQQNEPPSLPPASLSVQLFEKRLPSLFFSSPAGTPRLREQILLKAEDSFQSRFVMKNVQLNRNCCVEILASRLQVYWKYLSLFGSAVLLLTIVSVGITTFYGDTFRTSEPLPASPDPTVPSLPSC